MYFRYRTYDTPRENSVFPRGPLNPHFLLWRKDRKQNLRGDLNVAPLNSTCDLFPRGEKEH